MSGSASPYGNGDVQDRTKQVICRCGVQKNLDRVPPLMLCPNCDGGPYHLVRIGLPPAPPELAEG